MRVTPLTRRITASPLAPVAAFPLRLNTVARYNARVVQQSANWLIRSRENSSFTYDLTPPNLDNLAWFTAEATGSSVAAIRGYMREVEEDDALRQALHEGRAHSFRRRVSDPVFRYGRRVAYYAMVRALTPLHVVEAGPHRGISSCLIAAALLRNGRGRLTTVDVDPQAGEFIHGPYATVVDRATGDSAATLGRPEFRERGIDLLFLETFVTLEHEAAELDAAAPALSGKAVVLSCALAKTSPAMSRWSEAHHRRFLHFDERPRSHWHPGASLGASFPAS